jgi:RNA polymerase sigma factor (TIGR02999 family)
MSDMTRILSAAASGDPRAAEQLLPLVYEELRRLAARRLAREPSNQTLEPTALVHEAYLRLVGEADRRWDSRGHFFAAAAEAMRRILVEKARWKKARKHGGDLTRVDLAGRDPVVVTTPDEMIALDEALARLAEEDAAAAEVAKLRVFAGLSVEDAAEALGVARATAYRHWSYARAWLRRAVLGGPDAAAD